jgi:hypothetical protein
MNTASPARLCRLAAVFLALVANLVAAGVPVLHAMAHEFAEEHHRIPEAGTLAHVEPGDDAQHAASLHDERLVLKRQPVDLVFSVPAASAELDVATAPGVVEHRPVLRLSSRAPPTADLARAPPLV